MVTTAPAATSCCHCGKALDALARRRGADTCGAAACRHKAAVAHTARLKQGLAAAALVQRPAAQVVWLEHCEPQLVAVTAQDQAHQRAFLDTVLADAYVIDRAQLAESTADDTHPQGARLCAQCRGRCCQHGAGWRAFIDLTLLQRWQAQHTGSTLQDAVQAYVSMLPPEHVHGACLYQTAQGCNIPRQHRADICNGFACAALQQVQRAAAADAQAAVIAITLHKNAVERAALISAGATQPLHIATPQGPLA